MTAVDLTFDDLCEMEPKLRDLECDVREAAGLAPRTRRWCANGMWYGFGRHSDGWGFKDRLARLVGWGRKAGGVLSTSEAYDCASDHLYRLLPDCRRCGCG